jgi:tRNA-dihydrouridine synthase 3
VESPPSGVATPGNASPFAGRVFLAPLTKGGHLAFRRLCVSFGAEVTVSEMAVARRLLQNRAAEFALLRSHPSEPFFGVQLADKNPESLAEAGRIAEARGARFIDLNCGCPIREITGRGLGASLLRRATRLGHLVAALREAVRVPVTVKLRTGWKEDPEHLSKLAHLCEDAGASALTIHGRSREQHYDRAADWALIGRIAAERTIPVVGNGDILTHYEARDRRALSGVSSVMIARGALIKPWIFRELAEGRSFFPTPEERIGILFKLVAYMKDHFGADERGARRIMQFLPWHFSFFCRYRPLPEETFLEASRTHPLLQTRFGGIGAPGTLEALLADPSEATHDLLARELLASLSESEALDRLRRVGEAGGVPAPSGPGEGLDALVAG